MPENGIGAVIFDLDGTLLDTLADIAYSINSTLERHGLPVHPVDSFRRMVGSGFRNTVEMAVAGGPFEDHIDALASEASRAYADDPVSRTRFYDGIEQLLDALRNQGIPFAVLSNKPDYLVQILAREFFAGHGFTHICGHRDGLPRKPDPTTALHLAGVLGCDPSEVLFLGDTDIDMMTARNAGMKAIGAAWGFRDSEELVAAGAEAVLSCPEEVMAYMAGQ